MSTSINPNVYLTNNTQYKQQNKPITTQNVKSTPNFEAQSLNYKKISLGEGTKLFLKGIGKQGTEILENIYTKPLQTIAIAGGTTLGIMALPLIGIPTAVGGGILAIGFAGYSAIKGISHVKDFMQNNKDGSYHIARCNLMQLGEDSLDLALSAPFVPKSITHIKNFVKHGKIAVNTQLINDLKSASTFKNKWEILTNTDKNLTRSNNFKNAVDKELAKLEGLNDAQKAAIKKDLLEFDVPQEKISEVVIDKWAQIKGIQTKPDIKYKTLPQNIGGEAAPKECTITINDRKQNLQTSSFQEYKLVKTEINGNTYINTYKNNKTGATLQDTIAKDTLQAYEQLYKEQKTLTPQSKQILATLHEREHIHQYAQIYQKCGTQHFSLTPRAENLYKQMNREMPTIQPGSSYATEIENYATARNNGTPISYIKNAREIAARNAERVAMNNSDFQRLEQVFAQSNKTSIPQYENTIIWNTIRPEAAIN